MEKGVKWPEKRVTDRARCVCVCVCVCVVCDTREGRDGTESSHQGGILNHPHYTHQPVSYISVPGSSLNSGGYSVRWWIMLLMWRQKQGSEDLSASAIWR